MRPDIPYDPRGFPGIDRVKTAYGYQQHINLPHLFHRGLIEDMPQVSQVGDPDIIRL